jgi:hypothetical protein
LHMGGVGPRTLVSTPTSSAPDGLRRDRRRCHRAVAHQPQGLGRQDPANWSRMLRSSETSTTCASRPRHGKPPP